MSSSRQWSVDDQIRAYLATGSIAIVAVILRLISRKRTRIPFGWDDFFSVFAVIIFAIYCGIGAWAIFTGIFTPDLDSLPPKQLKLLLLGFYTSALLVNVVITSAKLSVLCFYLRLFDVNRRFRIFTFALIAVSVVWFIGTSLACALRCIPVQAAWDVTLQKDAKCVNQELITLVTESINCFTEFLMILLPINVIRRLQLPLRQRIGVSAIFALGFFTVATSIIRLVEGTDLEDSSTGIIESAIWASIQLCTAIVTGCMPTYRGLLPGRWIAAVSKWCSIIFTTSRRSSNSGASSQPDVEHVRQQRIVQRDRWLKPAGDTDISGLTVIESEIVDDPVYRSTSETTAVSSDVLKHERSNV